MTLSDARVSQKSRTDLFKQAMFLSWFTIIYNLIEGAVSIAFGLSDDSVALAGFGVDSLIEVGSACLVVWRLKGETASSGTLSLERERKATLGIGVLFLALGLITLGASGFQIYMGRHPETTLPGMIVSAISLSFMFFLWNSKKKVAKALDSKTVEKDAECSLACIKLSFVLFSGSFIFLYFPWLWWADAATAMIISFFILQEGWETVQNARHPDFTGGCGCSH